MTSFPTWIERIKPEGWRARLPGLGAPGLRIALAVGFALALGLTVVLMLFSLWGAQRTRDSLSRLYHVEYPVDENVLRVRIALLEARRYEKEFLLRWRELGFAEAQTRYVNLLRVKLAEIPPRLALIERLSAHAPEVTAHTAEIGAAASAYQRDFLAMVENLGQQGFTENGLEGRLRQRARAIEALLAENAPALRAELLQLRRLEKDYLLRQRSQDVVAFERAVAAFGTALATAALPPAVRAQLAALTRDYRELFAAHVRLSDDSEALRRAYLTAAARSEAPLQALEERADAHLDAIHDETLHLAASNGRIVLGAGLLALFFGLLVALTLWRKLTRQIDTTVALAERFARGDLRARLPAVAGAGGGGGEGEGAGEGEGEGEGEFARLTLALDVMAVSLQRTLDDLQRSNAELEERVVQRTRHLQAANRGLAEHTREIGLLAELDRALLDSDSRSDMQRAVVEFFARLFPLAAGRLYLRQGSDEAFASEVDWGGPCHAPPTLSADTCLALRQADDLCVCAEHPDAACRHSPEKMPKTAVLCIPLVFQATSFGVIYLEMPARGGVNGDAIDPADKMLAALVGKHVSLGLTNLRLRDSLRERAIRDVLTGLYNRRYLEETLCREIERARRKAGRLAAIMLDVDFFKRFNDSYGHEAGDVVLAAIGQLLRENVRASDVPCRYGGEEFTILLPDSDAALAAERAEELRRAAQALQLEYAGQALPPVTISLGVAESPLHGASGAALLAAADAALYRAKAGGRNRVEMAEAPAARMAPPDGAEGEDNAAGRQT